MRLKDLFTVSTGQKVTERQLRRVLFSSICSILLCMSCLVSTTWALFTVSIENTDNVIEIATVTADVTIHQEENEIGKSENGGYNLTAGTYFIQIRLENNATDADDLNKTKNPVYVLMSATSGEATQYFYFTFNGNSEAEQELQVWTESVSLNFSVSWIQPASASAISEGNVIIGESPEESPSESAAEEETEAPSDDPAIPSTEGAPADKEDEADGTPTEPADDEASEQETEATGSASETTTQDGTEDNNTEETTA